MEDSSNLDDQLKSTCSFCHKVLPTLDDIQRHFESECSAITGEVSATTQVEDDKSGSRSTTGDKHGDTTNQSDQEEAVVVICDYCGMDVSDPNVQASHDVTCMRDGSSETFDDGERSTVSISSLLPEPEFSCDLCNELFCSKLELLSHKASHVLDPTSGINSTTYKEPHLYTCRWCDKQFTVATHYHAHQKQHKRNSNKTCWKCFRDFPTAYQLHYHLSRVCGKKKVREPLKTHFCTTCYQVFSSEQRLAEHARNLCVEPDDSKSSVHGNSDEKLTVQIKSVSVAPSNSVQSSNHGNCKDEVITNVSVKVREHCKKARVELADISKEAKYANLCRKQVEQSKDETKCPETLLPKSEIITVDLTSVKQEIETFNCMLCNKEFPSIATMHEHAQTHSMRKPCPVCNKLFTDWQLEAHTRTHLNKPMFTCPTCPKSFTDTYRLNYHQARICGRKPKEKVKDKQTAVEFTCECGVSYKSQYMLTYHQLRKHGSIEGGSANTTPKT